VDAAIELMGWTASGLVFCAFWAQEMVTLRSLAISSNVAFITYGAFAHLWPIVALRCAMLPVNIHRLRQTAARKLG